MSEVERDCTVEAIATAIEKRGLASLALLFGEANRPLAFVSSHFLLIGQPLLGLVGWGERAAQWADVLGDRGAVERLIARLERSPDKGRQAAQ